MFAVLLILCASCIGVMWFGSYFEKRIRDQKLAELQAKDHGVNDKPRGDDEPQNAEDEDVKIGKVPRFSEEKKDLGDLDQKELVPAENQLPKHRGKLIIPFDAVASMARLEEVKAVRIKGQARFFSTLNVNDVVITWESIRRLKYDEENPRFVSNMVLIRDHGWAVKDGRILTLEGDGLGFYQNFNYAMILSNLIPLIEEGFEIEKGKDSVVRGKKCFDVTVRRADRPPMKLFFDKGTKLLYKAEFKGRFLDQNNKFNPFETFVEVFFTDYQLTDGINHWKKYEQWRDGKRYGEISVREVVFFKNAEDALFSTPELDQRIREALASYKESDRRNVIKKAIARLGPQSGSEFSRLVGGLSSKSIETNSAVRKALLAFADSWKSNQAPPFEASDVDSLIRLLKSDEGTVLRLLAGL